MQRRTVNLFAGHDSTCTVGAGAGASLVPAADGAPELALGAARPQGATGPKRHRRGRGRRALDRDGKYGQAERPHRQKLGRAELRGAHCRPDGRLRGGVMGDLLEVRDAAQLRVELQFGPAVPLFLPHTGNMEKLSPMRIARLPHGCASA